MLLLMRWCSGVTREKFFWRVFESWSNGAKGRGEELL